MKAKDINKIINYGIGISTAYFIGSAIAGAIRRKKEEGGWVSKAKSASGIGAAKRRIFKELSLAQKAGVNFTKKYDELTDEEITALQQVSNDTGYTETYYKSLKKAYDAISGIGAAYDVTDADGNTVLTWIEDPDGQTYARAYDPERDRAYLEEQEIEAERQWAAANKAREFEEREARLAEQRKRLRRAGRSSQMQLFGTGYAPEVETELYEIWREQIEYGDTDYDYETWRKVVGDEYVRDVMRYM